MKVVCDNCRAVYKVPDDKLTKAVNKATCRNCGHRMLIPRPKPNADPEERTLVTAVAPTPPGAPPREVGQDDLRMGTPMAAQTRETPLQSQTHSTSDEDFEGPDTKLSAVNPSEQITARESQRNARSVPPSSYSTGTGTGASAPPARLPPKRPSSPPSQPPAPVRVDSTGTRRTPAPRTPAPLPSRSQTGSRPAMYDPAGDLNWALLGTATALVGSFLLAFLSVWNEGTVGVLVMWFGLAMTFGGGLLTFMVLLTGGRGRRPAQTLLSVILGFMVAVVMSSTMVATKWGAERVIDVYDIHFSNEGLTAGVSVPNPPSVSVAMAPSTAPGTVAPATPAPGAPAPSVAETTPPPTPAPVAPPPAPGERTGRTAKPAPAPAPPPPPRPEPARPTPAPVAAAAPAPAIEPEDDVAPAPAPAPAAPKPGQLVTVPMEVVHVMLSNNIEIKKCFVPLFKAGTLPPRIDLKFNILPSGTATNAQVLQSAFKGTELEGCLVNVVTGIQFPPTTGSGTSITYPFVLAAG